ncbi:MAG TPA: HDOD domain-containing protein [Burkholderiaceae bacterium]
MTRLPMADIIKSVRELPALPVIVVELMSTMDQEDAGSNELANKLARDQALTAKTLRLANSSFYGMQSKVTSIQQAIAILGFNGVRTIVTTAAVIGNFSDKPGSGFDFLAFWRHAVASAVCAKLLAKHLRQNQDYAFMIGLLHDIGRLVLVTCSPQLYAEVLAHREQHDCCLIESEIAILGVPHTVVGSALAAHWKFPPLMQKAIESHHDKAHGSTPSLAGLVHIADGIAHALDLSGNDNDLVPPISAETWKSLALPQDIAESIFRDTEAQFEDACQILLSMRG